jgi:hypothetical protein
VNIENFEDENTKREMKQMKERQEQLGCQEESKLPSLQLRDSPGMRVLPSSSIYTPMLVPPGCFPVVMMISFHSTTDSTYMFVPALLSLCRSVREGFYADCQVR